MKIDFTGKDEIVRASITPKIREYPEEIKNENLKKVVIHILDLMAVKTATDEEIVAMVQFIKRKLDHFTFEEIITAVDHYVAGELNLDGKPMDVFQSMNAVAISKIMRGYQELKRNHKALEKFKRAQERSEIKEISREEKIRLSKAMIINSFREWKTEGTRRSGSHIVHDDFVAMGFIPENQHKELFHKATLEISRNAEEMFSGFDRRAMEIEGIEMMAKKIAVCDFFDQFKNEEDFVSECKDAIIKHLEDHVR